MPEAQHQNGHPNAMAALAKVRHKTQFGGPNEPARCAREECKGWRWKGSPGGFCWRHAGSAFNRQPRRSYGGHLKRALSSARYKARMSLAWDPPDAEARALATAHAYRLTSHWDMDRLLVLCRDYLRGHVDHRGFHDILGILEGKAKRQSGDCP